MMKKTVFLFIYLLFPYFLFAQWEFVYLSTRVGMKNNLYTAPPNKINQRSLNSPDGAVLLLPDISKNDTVTYFYFAPSFNADLLLNIDFNEYVGIAIGAQHSVTKLRYKYYTQNAPYILEEENTIHAIGIPLMLKLGIFEEQHFFFFIGGQYNINYELKQSQTTNFNKSNKYRYASNDEFRDNISFFAGVNLRFVTLEANYTLNTYFNKDYIDANNINPYSNQRGGYFMLRTSLYFSFSEDFLDEIF